MKLLLSAASRATSSRCSTALSRQNNLLAHSRESLSWTIGSTARRGAHKKHRTVPVYLLAVSQQSPSNGLRCRTKRSKIGRTESRVARLVSLTISNHSPAFLTEPICQCSCSGSTLGSTHDVAPGYMRNLLKPRKLAEYVRKSSVPSVSTIFFADLCLPFTHSPSLFISNNTYSHGSSAMNTTQAVQVPLELSTQAKPPTMDVDELATRLISLPTLVFHRRTQPDSSSSSSSSPPSDLIFGSVTIHDIVKHIETQHGLTLVAPDAILSFSDGQDRLRRKGEELVSVNLRNGKSLPLTVEIRDVE